MKQRCMCGDPECGVCGPLQGYGNTEERDYYFELRQRRRQRRETLGYQISRMITQISQSNYFDKRDMIELLKKLKLELEQEE